MPRSFRSLFSQVLLLSGACLALTAAPAGDWPGFRGDGSGRLPAAEEANYPLEWDGTDHVAWSLDLPGYGQSSPVLCGDRLYVTTAEGEEKETLAVLAIDPAGGAPLWKAAFPASVRIEATDMVSRSAPTPAADREGVYAFFESGDLYALTREGQLRWQRSLTNDYGRYEGGHGLGSSLAADGDTLFVLADHQGPSYLLALDKATGENRWRRERPSRISWTSPILARDRIWISSNGILEAWDPATGEGVWAVEGFEGNTVASPALSEDGAVLVIGSSAPRNSQGFDGEGNRLWTAGGVTSSFGSPLVHRGCAYFVNRAGALHCVDLVTGDMLWETRLSESCWASPVAVGEDRLYFFCKDGVTHVFAPDREEPRELARNRLDLGERERVYGVALADGRIVLRTGTRLIALGEDGEPAS